MSDDTIEEVLHKCSLGIAVDIIDAENALIEYRKLISPPVVTVDNKDNVIEVSFIQ